MFPTTLRKEIVVLLCIKALVLTAIYFAFFAPVTPPEPDKAALMAHLMSGG
jgi:hypothetical protein